MNSILRSTRPCVTQALERTVATNLRPNTNPGNARTINKTANKTSSFADFIAFCDIGSLPVDVISRSKRMVLDTLGVGVIGARSEASCVVRQWALGETSTLDEQCGDARENDRRSGDCTVWGTSGQTTSATTAAFLNGVSIHSMDYDDTWHPATHPSGSVLATLFALAEQMISLDEQRSLSDLLVAFNVGVEVQGRLLRCSTKANHIPTRFHPPAVVGVMGSAAAACSFLKHDPHKCRHALAIAASFAGAPMANAGTKTKPLHCGKSARSGLESALLADAGIEGNENILDLNSGFGVFFEDYDTQNCGDVSGFVLEEQDVAIKRYPTHLGTHWAIDAALEARNNIADFSGKITLDDIQRIVVNVPDSRYINRPFPATEYDARHSFQFNVCTALLDGQITPESYSPPLLRRTSLTNLLNKTVLRTTPDNISSFDTMYVDVTIVLSDSTIYTTRCETPYGHWRRPLTTKDLYSKFLHNTSFLSNSTQMQLIAAVEKMDSDLPASELIDLL